MEFVMPWHALFGGMLLGLSAGILLLCSGKVAGISGILGGVLMPKSGDVDWRIAFLSGMVVAALLLKPFGFSLPNLPDGDFLLVILAGGLVGFGTRIGNGCTSGHGIIGIGRWSKRSIVATLIFMLTAILVVFVRRSLGGL